MTEAIEPIVYRWWLIMSGIGVFNILLWFALGYRHWRRVSDDPHWARYWRLQWVLSGVYVLGCASRCFVLRSDIKRFALIDTWFASVGVGRTIATFAELAFVAQWAVLLTLFARVSHSRKARSYALVLVPLILLAEVGSWYAVVTTNYAGSIFEESLWALTAGLMMLGLLMCRRQAPPAFQRPIIAGLTLGFGYVTYMVTVDVPSYVRAWMADEASGKRYLAFSEGLQDLQRVVVTGRAEDWQYAMVWMTLYFSVAVWISLAMVYWPKEVRFAAPSASD